MDEVHCHYLFLGAGLSSSHFLRSAVPVCGSDGSLASNPKIVGEAVISIEIALQLKIEAVLPV